MGQKESLAQGSIDFESLALRSGFTPDQVKTFYGKYSIISSSIQNDGVIDKQEFRQALGMASSAMAERIFAAFDIDNSSGIEFEEFIVGLGGIAPNTPLEKKAEFVFRVFDLDHDGNIDRSELSEVLRISLETNKEVKLSEEQIGQVIDATFHQIDLNSDDLITFEEFKQAVIKNPSILNCVTLNLEHMDF